MQLYNAGKCLPPGAHRAWVGSHLVRRVDESVQEATKSWALQQRAGQRRCGRSPVQESLSLSGARSRLRVLRLRSPTAREGRQASRHAAGGWKGADQGQGAQGSGGGQIQAGRWFSCDKGRAGAGRFSNYKQKPRSPKPHTSTCEDAGTAWRAAGTVRRRKGACSGRRGRGAVRGCRRPGRRGGARWVGLKRINVGSAFEGKDCKPKWRRALDGSSVGGRLTLSRQRLTLLLVNWPHISLSGSLNTGATHTPVLVRASWSQPQHCFSFPSHGALPDLIFPCREHEIESPHPGIKFLPTPLQWVFGFCALPKPPPKHCTSISATVPPHATHFALGNAPSPGSNAGAGWAARRGATTAPHTPPLRCLAPAFQPCAQSLTFSAAVACVFWVTEIAQPLGPCRPSLSSTQRHPQLPGSRGVRLEQGRAQLPTALPHAPPRAEPGWAASPHVHPFQPPHFWRVCHHCEWRWGFWQRKAWRRHSATKSLDKPDPSLCFLWSSFGLRATASQKWFPIPHTVA